MSLCAAALQFNFMARKLAPLAATEKSKKLSFSRATEFIGVAQLMIARGLHTEAPARLDNKTVFPA